MDGVLQPFACRHPTYGITVSDFFDVDICIDAVGAAFVVARRIRVTRRVKILPFDSAWQIDGAVLITVARVAGAGCVDHT